MYENKNFYGYLILPVKLLYSKNWEKEIEKIVIQKRDDILMKKLEK
jgi:hypothetical protein